MISKDLPFGGPINPPRLVPRRHAHPNFIALGKHVFDDQFEIGEGCAQELDVALHALDGRVKAELVLDEVGIEVFGQDGEITIVERFIDNLAKIRIGCIRLT